mgnify:CR=1 FL=1
MKQLVDVEGDYFFLFEKVYQPVQHELNDSQDVATGDKPDSSGMYQGVAAEAIKPKGARGQVRILRPVMSIFVECKELSLERVIAQCMSNKQCKEDGERMIRHVAPGKGLDVL